MILPTLFQIGRKIPNEFKPLLTRIHRLATVAHFDRIGDATLFLQNHSTPNLFLLLQAYPGCFNSINIQLLQKTAAFTPLLLLLGAAAEGEARTGTKPPHVNRLYVNDWNDFHDKQLENLALGRSTVWTAPLPLEEDEIILQRVNVAKEPNEVPGNCAALRSRLFESCFVVSRFETLGNDSEMNRMLAASYPPCLVGDISAISSPCHLLADADDAPFEEIFKAVQRLRQRFADADITVYINSPRFHEKIGLVRAGADRVLAKPFFR